MNNCGAISDDNLLLNCQIYVRFGNESVMHTCTHFFTIAKASSNRPYLPFVIFSFAPCFIFDPNALYNFKKWVEIHADKRKIGVELTTKKDIRFDFHGL